MFEVYLYNKNSLVLIYSGDLNTKLVQYSNGQKEVGCQMVWYLNAI